jgi:hypothetical protein
MRRSEKDDADRRPFYILTVGSIRCKDKRLILESVKLRRRVLTGMQACLMTRPPMLCPMKMIGRRVAWFGQRMLHVYKRHRHQRKVHIDVPSILIERIQ